MKRKLQQIQRRAIHYTKIHLRDGLTIWKLPWFQIFCCLIIAYGIYNKNISIQVNMNSLGTENSAAVQKFKPQQVAAQVITKKKLSPEEIKIRKKRSAYIEKYAKLAQEEMKKYGIPASIKLAQGILETNAGSSSLAVKNNNHFGIKCFSRKCKKGHCSNFLDDSHKDFFVKYKSVWESYRAHSKLLNNKRYRKLKKLGTKDYKNWAYGLKKLGYATDKQYAQKLIKYIEELELYQFDN